MPFEKGHKDFLSKEARKKLAGRFKGKGNPFWGKKHSEETKKKISESKKGERVSIKTEFKKGERLNEDHPLWKGEEAGYCSKHKWVYRRLGKPNYCENCQSTDSKKYEWSNISGEYKRNLSDWVRLCTKCHHRVDKISTKGWITRKNKCFA